MTPYYRKRGERVSGPIKRSVTAWAWAVSIGFHLVLLAVFAVVRFSYASESAPAVSPQASLARIKAIADSTPIVQKPKVRSRIRLSRSRKTPVDLVNRDRIKPFPQTFQKSKLSITIEAGGSIGRSMDSARTGFFGSFTELRKICYVVDCSGSMLGFFGRVRAQLKSSIVALQPDQYFYIIFFRGDSLVESGYGLLVRATPKAKADAYRFIDNAKLGGPTNALAAIERAMKIRGPQGKSPEQIYFLTDGFDLQGRNDSGFGLMIENTRKTLAPSARINTIGFGIKPADEKILRDVADSSGGEFVNVK